jgi:hypothetical protein
MHEGTLLGRNDVVYIGTGGSKRSERIRFVDEITEALLDKQYLKP